jgi:hypothetical protein
MSEFQQLEYDLEDAFYAWKFLSFIDLWLKAFKDKIFIISSHKYFFFLPLSFN